MKSDVYWIPGPRLGKLAILPRPRGGDWLNDEIQGWCEAGIDVVVSLLTEAEASELGLSDEAKLVRRNGLTFISFPIDDYSVPSSEDATLHLVTEIDDLLSRDKCVGIHCRQGIGRSSLVTACLLVTSGQRVDESFQQISNSRGLSVPDTSDQQNWVSGFAQALLSSAAKTITSVLIL